MFLLALLSFLVGVSFGKWLEGEKQRTSNNGADTFTRFPPKASAKPLLPFSIVVCVFQSRQASKVSERECVCVDVCVRVDVCVCVCVCVCA